MKTPPAVIHPESERQTPSKTSVSQDVEKAVELDTFGGKLFVDWDQDAEVTPQGQLSFFINFLKLGARFTPWVEQCPLSYHSNNAPSKIDVLGSFVLSILSGHRRYAHLANLQSDRVNAQLLGMSKIISDDSAIRALRRLPQDEAIEWMQAHLLGCCHPLLNHPWILDADVTIKPLYGRQEGAVVGYNPHKPGRPSHTYHTYLVANLRLVLEVQVQAGNQSAAAYSAPGLMALLERLPNDHRPEFVRGDCDWGCDAVMSQLEDTSMDYLFKLKKSPNVQKLIHKHHSQGGWQRFNESWEAKESSLSLASWHRARRVVVVRRRVLKDADVAVDYQVSGQQSLGFIEGPESINVYEYAVLVTSLEVETIAVVQHYRDRADCENVFDELKNHWGWGGYATQDLEPCQTMARMIALVYNWWSLFVRLINPDSHWEAITSRPRLLSSVGRLTRSSRQTTLTITGQHACSAKLQQSLLRVQALFKTIQAIAPQLSDLQRWTMLLEEAVRKTLPITATGPPKLAECQI